MPRTKAQTRGSRALFVFPDGKMRFLEVEVKKSAIEGAGKGAFVTCDVPKGAYCVYRGVFKKPTDTTIVMEYSWSFYRYDELTGKIDDEVIGYVDASLISKSNFTRFVNCGLTRKDNNVKHDQVFGQIRYVMKRDVKKGEELFCDYGRAYRRENLGMKGKY